MNNNPFELPLLTADDILNQDWPEPTWAIPDVLPVGLTILAGPPKVGKSWLGLQVALSVSSGNLMFGRQVTRGPTLYLALEDPPRRLKHRMIMQNWPSNLQADFLPMGLFMEEIGDLRNGGSVIISNKIQQVGYRLVVIDTFSRAIKGKQDKVEDMTEWLSPLQEMAHDKNCSILAVDHHRKTSGFEPDAIADILGSTAKGAMADTVLGLYKEPHQLEAKLHVIGREVLEQTLSLKMDRTSGTWKLTSSGNELAERENEILRELGDVGPIGV